MDAVVATQLPLQFPEVNRFSLAYFISHSGVIEALNLLRQSVAFLLETTDSFRLVYLVGAEGSGKTHLLRAMESYAIEQGLESSKIFVLDHLSAKDAPTAYDLQPELIASFVAQYEKMRNSGGLIIVASRFTPLEVSENPHFVSRLQSGICLRLDYPREEELEPLLISLLESNNLRVSEDNLSYLLKRIPANPLFFADIATRISQLCLAEGKSAGRGIIRSVLQDT